MRSFYRIPMLVFMLFAQVTVMMAQGNKPETIPSSVYGIYEGEATTEVENKGTKMPGSKKKVKIEISKGEQGFTVVTLKDFTLGKFSFDKVPFKECQLRPQTDKWQVYLYSNLYGSFTTKDNKYVMQLEGNIDEDKSFVHKDGTLDLDFTIIFNETRINHVFKGKKVKDTTGINKLTQQSGKQTMYDLQGRRVEKPSKGIYVVNGKKIVY